MSLIGNTPRSILFLCGAVVVLSIAHSFWYQIRVSVDALAYDQIGWNLVQGNGYVEDAANRATPERDNAIARVGPGYEFFLAGVYALFGHTVWVVWVIQALLRGATVFLVYRIGQRLFLDDRVAGVAALLFGFSPDLIMLSSMLLTETLGLFLAALFFYLTLQYLAHPSWLRISGVGVSLSAAFMTRTTFLLAVPVLLIVLFWLRRYGHAFMIAALCVLIVTPWTLRNYRVFGEIIPTNAVGGYDLWVGNNPGATGGFVKTPEIQAMRDTHHVIELDRIGKEKYIEFLTSQPGAFLALQIKKASIYFSMLRPTGFWPYLNRRPIDQFIVVAASTVWTALLFWFGLAGALMLARRDISIERILLLAYAALQPAAVIPLIVESRYRVSIFLFLALLGAYAIASSVSRKMPFFIVSAGVLLCATAIDLIAHWGEFAVRLGTLLS